MATKFSSVFKSATDLLNKPFNFDHKVEFKAKASNGAVFTADTSIADKDGSAKGNLKVEYKKDNFSVDKLTIGTDKKITGEFKLKNAAKNVDVTFKATDGSRASGSAITAAVGAVYTDSEKNLVVTADANMLSGPDFDFSALYNYKGVLVGGTAKVGTGFLDSESSKGADLTDYNALIGYRAADFTAAIQTTKTMKHVDVSIVHGLGSGVESGAIASFDVEGAAPFGVSFGGKYKIDSDASLNGRVESTGKVSLAFNQKLNSFATLKASGQVDALALDSDNHKFGLTLCMGH